MDGVRDGELRARVAAPPVDGAANASLVHLIADELDVAPSLVRVVTGSTGRRKTLAVRVARDRVIARWPGLRL